MKGRTLAVCDVDVTNSEGTLVAKGRVSYALHLAALLTPDAERGRQTVD